MSKLSVNLQKLMQEHHLRMVDLARKTGISSAVINRLCHGITTNPNVDTLRPMAHFFNVSINELMGDDPLPDRDFKVNTIPLLAWKDLLIPPKKREIQDHVFVLNRMSANAYALKVEDSAMEPKFSKGTLIIINPEFPAEDRDYVVVHLGKQPKPVFKQMLLDGANIYFRSHHPDFKLIKTRNFSILGTVIEARIELGTPR